MHDRGCNGVGPHRQAANGINRLKFCEQLQHHVADQRGHSMVQADLTQVDIERRFLAAGEGEIPVVNGVLGDELNEVFSRAAHTLSLASRFRLAS